MRGNSESLRNFIPAVILLQAGTFTVSPAVILPQPATFMFFPWAAFFLARNKLWLWLPDYPRGAHKPALMLQEGSGAASGKTWLNSPSPAGTWPRPGWFLWERSHRYPRQGPRAAWLLQGGEMSLLLPQSRRPALCLTLPQHLGDLSKARISLFRCPEVTNERGIPLSCPRQGNLCE